MILWKMQIIKQHMPKILGIVNVTPDSFSDGGCYNSTAAAVERAVKMLDAGVEAVDIGGESTRPGSLMVAADEELARVLPVVTELRRRRPQALISVDTRKSTVATAVLNAGADIINDVSMLMFDAELAAAVAAFPDRKLVIGHTRGTPDNMRELAVYDDVVKEVYAELLSAVQLALAAGIKRENIILDPGLGFAKNSEQNITLLNELPELSKAGYPIMIGHSRKRFIGELCNLPEAAERDAATLALSVSLIGRVEWLRVHNAVEHALAFRLLQYLK